MNRLPPKPSDSPIESKVATRVLDWMQQQREVLLDLLEKLVRIESPSREPHAQPPLFAAIETELHDTGYRTLRLRGHATGGSLYARPSSRERRSPAQLLLGHVDTVWPVSTLGEMPVTRAEGRMRGPGVYDMKAGVVQMIFALRALRDLDLDPPFRPVVLLNSDEEIGSRESTRAIERLARCVERTYVLEPSLGHEGSLKTARKGVGRFTITARGRAAHAGLDPEGGVSAILELSHVIQKLFDLNDPERGVSVNVGTIDGGLGANVIAPESRAIVDVRVLTHEDAQRIERTIHGLEPSTPGAELEIQGGIGRPPMIRTSGTRALWELAHALGLQLGIELQEATAGGGSDGNTTSAFTPTLDGLGAVGDGAHAAHEFVFTDRLVERAALLTLLLLAPSTRAAGEDS